MSALAVGAMSPAHAQNAAAAGSLSSGADAEFRARMLSWNPPPVATRAGQPMLPPVALGRLSSAFGVRADPFTGGHRRHAGIDLPGAYGTPVLAAADGVVAIARRAGGYGNLVEIEHGEGLETRYAHLSQIDVAPGTAVHRGDVVGLIGSTGRSTGNHLHFEVRLDGRPSDPLALLGEEGRAPDAPLRPVALRWAGWDGPVALDRLPVSRLK